MKHRYHQWHITEENYTNKAWYSQRPISTFIRVVQLAASVYEDFHDWHTAGVCCPVQCCVTLLHQHIEINSYHHTFPLHCTRFVKQINTKYISEIVYYLKKVYKN